MAFEVNGKPYRIVDQTRVGAGRSNYAESMRPSQPSEARLNTKTWKLSGPIGNSRQSAFGDPLGPDYTVNLDGRNDGLLTSASQRTAVALTALSDREWEVPTSDVLKTNWSEGAGDGDGDAFDELDEGVTGAGTRDDATTYWTTTTNSAEITLGFPAPSATIRTDQDFSSTVQFRVRSASTSPALTLTLYEGATILAQFAATFGGLTAATWTTISWGTFANSVFAGVTLANVRVGIQRTVGSGAFDLSAVEIGYGLASNVITIDEDRGQLFVQRGSHSTQVNPADMTEAQDVDHGSQVTDSVASWQGTGFVALGSADLVQKRTAVVAATSATYADVTAVKLTKMAYGPDRFWGVIADGGLDDGEVAYAFDAALTLSNGIPVADTNSGEITGLYTLGELMIAGTKRGPRSFTDAGAPAILGESVLDFPSSLNGASGASLWGWHYHGTKLGLNAIKPSGPIENPVGPGEGEDGLRFEGPIDGYPIAVKAFKGSLWVSYLSTAGDSWLLRGVFNRNFTDATGRPDWYVVRKLTGVECHAISATTGRTVPALVWGEDADIAYADLAFRGREIADTTNYVYGTDGGQWFGTTLVMPVGLIASVRWAKFFTDNCDANNNWTLAVKPDDGAYVDVGVAVVADGQATVRPAAINTVSAFSQLEPRLTQVAASTTAPPQIRGDLTIAIDERPEHVREIEVVVEVNGSDLADLQALANAAQQTPVPLRIPTQTDVNTDLYGYVLEVSAEDLRDTDDMAVRLKIIEWTLA